MSERQRIGFILNPIAGMGGPVALKGTDDAIAEARERGAEPVSPGRARRFLDVLDVQAEILTCSGPMGADVCTEAGFEPTIVLEVREPTTPDDTEAAARRLLDEGVDLLVFVGGDGTAVDIAQAIDHEVPVLGVPGGVKMNSAVFGETPERAARAVHDALAGRTPIHTVDVVEVDEDRLREGEIERVELGSLRVPDHRNLQAGKAASGGGLAPIVEAGRELAQPGTRLVLGPGSTVNAIEDELLGEGQGTLLGVDLVTVDGDGRAELAIADATAEDLAEEDEALIVVSPIGGQGFVVGRGNQQLSPGLLTRVGWDNVHVVATPTKLNELEALRADTGDRDLDERAPAYVDVLTGPGFRTRKRLIAGTESARRR
jgi:NAD+ kinase